LYKLLIADDEVLERKSMRIVLKKNFSDLQILEDAKTGNEAISLAKEYKPHIILMDIRMPEKSGLEAQQDIVKFIPNVKTIILTAYDSFKFAQTAIKFGVFDYILKPAKPTEIKESIEKAIFSLGTNQIRFFQGAFPINADENIIQEAMNYINKNFNKNISLESVACHIHLTPQYFSRYFKSTTGLNFIDYISKLRIKAAKKLLVTTNNSISSISLNIGYIDQSYFSKVFIKYEGVSPHKYRSIHKKYSMDL
jgi:YesN/AraC family two-component response regulator